MGRMLHIDWKTWLAFAFALLVIFIVVDRERVANTNDALVTQSERGRVDAAKERDRLLDGQRQLQSQVDRLSDQNAALVDLFEQSGGTAPPSLVGSRTVIEQDDNDDDGGGTVIVRPPAPTPPRPSPTTPQGDDDDDGTQIDLPDVPLPDEAGEATDTAKRIVDDLTGIKLD